MHRSPHLGALFGFDPKIKWTFDKLKRQRAFPEEPAISTMVGGEDV